MDNYISFPELPYYLKVKRVIKDDIVSFMVESKIHVNKEAVPVANYFIDYAQSHPNAVRDDVLCAIVKRFGLKLDPPHYS